MKIALLTDGIFPYAMGGMQKHSFYLCKYLVQRGIKIDLYHTNQQDKYNISELEFFTEEEKANITSIVIPFPASDKLPGHYIRASKKYSDLVYAQFQAREAVDFVYIQGFTGWKLLIEKKKGNCPIPTMLNFHGLEMFQISTDFKASLINALFRPFVRKNIQLSDYVQSLGGKLTDILLQILHHQKDRVLEIPIGISEDWINPKTPVVNNIRKFVFVGRYERRKGIEELNIVLEKLKDTYKFEIQFIGPISDDKQVKGNNIVYHGQTSDTDKIKTILQNADFLVCPSYSEGMPTVIIEAMASGCAIIATDVGAVSVATSNENGWLIPPANIDILEKTMVDAINLPQAELLQKKMKSIQRVKAHFLWADVVDKNYQVIEKVVVK